MEGSADLLSLSHRRYGLPEPEAAPASGRDGDEPAFGAQPRGQAAGEGRRHLSAHERRLAKKVPRTDFATLTQKHSTLCTFQPRIRVAHYVTSSSSTSNSVTNRTEQLPLQCEPEFRIHAKSSCLKRSVLTMYIGARFPDG